MSFNSIHEDFVDQVRASTDIVKVISKYVHLQRKGNRYWGCCPFHNEKTPSFSVIPDKGFFYCFGCHAGGNAFKFISLIEKISYYEAIKLQAEQLNIPIPKMQKTPQEELAEQERQDLYRVLDLATSFFHNCLCKTQMGQIGLDYWQKRQITADIIEKFQLGYAPNQWDKLVRSFNERGITNKILLNAGLITERDQKIYDRFRHRVIIPIVNEFGKTVGFGGRVLSVDGKPKYLNSPESPVFNKRNLLFGLNHAKQAISQENFTIVVEGYMDAITLHAHGICNVVASLGTAFTVQQCRKLMRYSPHIYFCYDGDNAGQQAILRAIEIVVAAGAKAKVIQLLDAKDPDEFIWKYGVDKLKLQIQNAILMMDFQINHVLNSVERNTIEGKLAAINQILPILSQMTQAVEQNEYIIRLSNMLGIDEGMIRSDLYKIKSQGSYPGREATTVLPGVNSRKASQDNSDALRRASRIVIKYIWEDPQILDYINTLIPSEEFPYKEHVEILKYIAGHANFLSDAEAAVYLSEEAYAELSHCLVDESDEGASEEVLEDCLRTLRRYYLNTQYERHRLLADELQRRGDNGFIIELQKAQDFRRQLDELITST